MAITRHCWPHICTAPLCRLSSAGSPRSTEAGAVDWVLQGSSRPSTASPRASVSNLQGTATAPASLVGSSLQAARTSRQAAGDARVRGISAGPVIMRVAAVEPQQHQAAVASPTFSPQRIQLAGTQAPPAKPVSARATVPARMAADLKRITALVAPFRNLKLDGAPGSVQTGGGTAAGALFRPGSSRPVSGFRSDLGHKLAYPQVDIRALI
jgi:hypothetical protein